MRYKCLVVDDHEIERDALEMHLRKISQLEILAVCKDGMEAAGILSQTSIDIVFSDIDMPELSGIGLLKSIKKQPLFIFITAHGQYAAESYEVDAIDFVVKPATFERVLKAANKAIEYLELKKQVSHVNENVYNAPANQDDHFFFKETKGITKLKYDEVIYMESMGDFSKIFTKNEMHVILVSLKNLEKQLPEHYFARVHKQFMINKNHIITLTNHEVHLTHDFVVPISAANRQHLLENAIDQKILSRFIK
ncbi:MULTISPECIES: LytR/AlgR family response regulator transcription factor [unclassified Pedobacter]|uniref:LytR/AlgR family response regulator transcription factor n=1 Tax=unclassified Pedobacter TaxID=2628915 RepID=UPI0022465DA3|nr:MULTISPECIES: LytTR family DNA-binding domain-containing protein [unclassified Pedobacter]MCX2429469.1 LytTR family DNA-binding domain-containing protein [Pedobacter sp. GR22-10]MCX2586350.1 LytTR family DNA-binding domain-containing protein [Pedobacter sp. MR22-3]